MSDLFWCTHENNRGTRMTVLHGGSRCTSEWKQDNDCTLYHKSWTFIRCVRASNDFALKGGKVRKVSRSGIKAVPAAKRKKATRRKATRKTATRKRVVRRKATRRKAAPKRRAKARRRR